MADTKGIDLSQYNTVTDWNKVKKDGVKFIILRAIIKSLKPDPKFEEYYAKANSVGIPVIGVYHYSYATTKEKGTNDAKAMVKILGNRKTTVWLDLEDISICGKGLNLINAVIAYRKVIESSGNKFGIYTGYSFYNSNLKPYYSYIKDVPIWLSRYRNTQPKKLSDSYTKDTSNIPNTVGYQYTDKGRVNGISRDVDLNVFYDLKNVNTIKPDDSKITNNSTSSVKQGTVTANSLNIRNNSNSNASIIGILKKGSVVSYDSESNGFVRIAGWISEKYLSINGNSGTVTANSLYIRNNSNSSDAEKLGYLNKGSQIMIYNKANGFCYFEGFVSKKYIK